MPTKRDELSAEIKRRLRAGLNSPLIIEGEGGVWGKWSRELPCVHIFEDAAEYDLIKPGLYSVILPVQVEFVTRLTERRAIFSEGREKLNQLQSALELDERFTKGKGTTTESDDLAISFSMVVSDIVEVVPSVLDVAVVYHFSFTERFLGYESKRH